MQSVRVGVITFDWYPYEPRALRLTEAAVDAGYVVDVVCVRKAHEKFVAMHAGTHLYRLPLRRAGNHSLAGKMLFWCLFVLCAGFTITCLHLRHRYKIIHVHNMPDFLVFSALVPKLLGAKVILDVQDVTPELMRAKSQGRKSVWVMRLATWQERISTKFANHIVTTGPLFEECLLKRGVPAEKITNILNSADPSLFPPERRCPPPFETSTEESRPFILMYHGTLGERNGLDTAIRALALARATVPNLRLDIQGGGDHLTVLKRLAEELDLGDSVRFSGSVTVDKLVDFVVHGDVGIIPYRSDGFMDIVLPTKAYEFAWMGRAMIASDTRALRSMFRPGAVALCDPDSPEAFAEAIIDLYQHPEKRARMIEDAAQDYEPYRWEAMAKLYQHLLKALLA
ncbi:MAG TPA: glycosyltransferase family 4 protein [Ktedonobacteraceae bacterium]|nr:glycosyltransferase family 4 protein [Ktedonobacteraceae bacterium]